MSSNETLAEALHGLVDDEQPFLGDVVANGLTQGKKLHRKRVVGRVAGATAAVATVAAVGTFAVGAPWTASPSGEQKQSKLFEAELATEMKALLPAVGFKTTPEPKGEAGAVAVLKDPLKSSVTVSASSYGSSRSQQTCMPPAVTSAVHCADSVLPDGSWLTVEKDIEPDGWVAQVRVALNRPDGTLVTARQNPGFTGPQEAPSGHPALPLTVDQMTALVQNPAWIGIAPPASAAQIVTAAPGVSVTAIRPVVASLLPTNLHQDDTGLNEDPGRPFVPSGDYYTIVDDGHGKSLLVFSVAPASDNSQGSMANDSWSGDICKAGEVQCKVVPQPDGSTLKVWKHTPGSESTPTTQVGQATVRGETRTVSVMEYNTATILGTPTRTTLPLTLDQLTDLVTNPVWNQLK